MVLLAFALRVALVPFNSRLFEDLMDAEHIHSWEPGNVARALVAGRGFGSPFVSNQLSAIMPPVYPVIVAGFFRVFGVHTAASIFAIHVFDCLINALVCIPLFRIARRSFCARTARRAAWAWVFFPYGIYFAAAWAWSTHLLMLGLCWLMDLAQRMGSSGRLRLWAGFGLLAGITGLAEPSVLLVVPFLLLLSMWELRRVLPGVVAVVALTTVLMPWLVRNERVFHRFVPMRDSMGLELWMGNNGNNLRWTSDDLHPLHDGLELAAYNQLGETAYMDRKAQQARAYIGQHEGWYAWMCVRRAVYLWTGYWSFDPRYLAQEPMDPENIPFATLITLGALGGLFLEFRRRPAEAIRYAGVLLLLPLPYFFTHPEPYHLRALDPVLVLLGCHAVLTLRTRSAAHAQQQVSSGQSK